jgi:hypothetical protein
VTELKGDERVAIYHQPPEKGRVCYQDGDLVTVQIDGYECSNTFKRRQIKRLFPKGTRAQRASAEEELGMAIAFEFALTSHLLFHCRAGSCGHAGPAACVAALLELAKNGG